MGHTLTLDQTDDCSRRTRMVEHLEGHGVNSDPIPCQIRRLLRRRVLADQRPLTAVH
jgi:hypothetical protein